MDRFMREMGARALVEWEQFFYLQSGKAPRKVSEEEFRSRFGARVVKAPRKR